MRRSTALGNAGIHRSEAFQLHHFVASTSTNSLRHASSAGLLALSPEEIHCSHCFATRSSKLNSDTTLCGAPLIQVQLEVFHDH